MCADKKRKSLQWTPETSKLQRLANADILVFKLNRDCLLEIFKYLPTLDLCSVSDTCVEFMHLANDHFQTKYCNTFYSYGDAKDGINFQVTKTEQRKILSHFGQFIPKLIIDRRYICCSDNDSLMLVAKHCQQLTELHFLESCVDNFKRCEIIQTKLKKLLINHSGKSSESIYEKFITPCKNLKELVVIGKFRLNCEFLLYHYPKIEMLILKNVGERCDSYIREFIQNNRHIKRIELIRCDFVSDNLINTIAKYNDSVEEICIEIANFTPSFHTNMLAVQNMENLRRLEFNCGNHSIVPIIAALATKNLLQCLSISETQLNLELCTALSQLTNLKTLKLISMKEISKDFAAILSKNLTKLEELYLCYCNAIQFKDILKFSSNSITMERLLIMDCPLVTLNERSNFFLLIEARKRMKKLNIYVGSNEFEDAKMNIGIDQMNQNMNYVQLLPIDKEKIDGIIGSMSCSITKFREIVYNRIKSSHTHQIRPAAEHSLDLIRIRTIWRRLKEHTGLGIKLY